MNSSRDDGQTAPGTERKAEEENDGESVSGVSGGAGMPCPLCGTPVTCGAATGAETCWCFDWPRLPPDARLNAGSCLCPACLRTALSAAGVALRGTAADTDAGLA